jgi:hypothetical protein
VVIRPVAIEIFVQITHTDASSDHPRFHSIFGIPAPLFGFYDSL